VHACTNYTSTLYFVLYIRFLITDSRKSFQLIALQVNIKHVLYKCYDVTTRYWFDYRHNSDDSDMEDTEAGRSTTTRLLRVHLPNEQVGLKLLMILMPHGYAIDHYSTKQQNDRIQRYKHLGVTRLKCKHQFSNIK